MKAEKKNQNNPEIPIIPIHQLMVDDAISLKQKLIRSLELIANYGQFDMATLLRGKNGKPATPLIKKGWDTFSRGIIYEETIDLLKETGCGLYLTKDNQKSAFGEREMFSSSKQIYINHLFSFPDGEKLFLYLHYSYEKQIDYPFIKALDTVSQSLQIYLNKLPDTEAKKILSIRIQLNPDYLIK